MSRQSARTTQSLSQADARRIALSAQGFAVPRRTGGRSPGKSEMLRVLRSLGALQLDSVNVLVRSHYLPLFSRLGAYSQSTLDDLSGRAPRALFEYWGHEASLLPVECYPLFRWRMDDARCGNGIWGGPARLASERPDFIRRVLDFVATHGPVTAGELPDGGQSTGSWWGWSDGKRALEYLFWTGQVTSAGRRGFERCYAIPDLVLPKGIARAPDPPRDEAQRELMRIAARALGVATYADLRDYFRMPTRDARSRIAELTESRELEQVSVEGWAQPGYVRRGRANLKAVGATRALLSPFDSLIWNRPRTERIFGFHYRLAFYTPRHLRSHGYYVMPFLMGDRLVARLDLKADRKARTLLVLGGHAEPGATIDVIAPALRTELENLAIWLGLGGIGLRSDAKLPRALGRF